MKRDVCVGKVSGRTQFALVNDISYLRAFALSLIASVFYLSHRIEKSSGYLYDYHSPNVELVKEYNVSLVISTYKRTSCFINIFEKVLQYAPVDEIVIVDDNSQDYNKTKYLNEIKKTYSNVKVIVNPVSYGSFASKLTGFYNCTSDYIVSIDDDDNFDDGYYQEIIAHINPMYDFVIPYHNFFNKYFSSTQLEHFFSLTLEFHNHVAMAFRKSLLDGIQYLPYIKCVTRDDCPIMAPLYYKSTPDKFYLFKNRYKYIVQDGNDCGVRRQSLLYTRSYMCVLNGYKFLKDHFKKYHPNYSSYPDIVYRSYIDKLKNKPKVVDPVFEHDIPLYIRE